MVEPVHREKHDMLAYIRERQLVLHDRWLHMTHRLSLQTKHGQTSSEHGIRNRSKELFRDVRLA